MATIEPNFKKLRQDNLDGKMRDQVEAEERRKDKEKMKKRKESDLPGAVMQINKYVVCKSVCCINCYAYALMPSRLY